MRHERMGWETSCDETGLAIYDSAMNGGRGGRACLRNLYSQINLRATIWRYRA